MIGGGLLFDWRWQTSVDVWFISSPLSMYFSICWVMFVYLLLHMYICHPWRCIKFALRICVGDCLRFLPCVRDLSFARHRLLRFLPRMIICYILNARTGFRADIHLGYLILMPLCYEFRARHSRYEWHGWLLCCWGRPDMATEVIAAGFPIWVRNDLGCERFKSYLINIITPAWRFWQFCPFA